MPAMTGRSWIPSLTSARLRLLSTGSGRARMQRAENSTRARSSSNRPNFPIDNSKFNSILQVPTFGYFVDLATQTFNASFALIGLPFILVAFW